MLSRAHVRRAASSPSPQAARAIDELREAALATRAKRLAELAPPGSWEARLGADLAAVRSADAQVVVLDEALGEIESGLLAVRGWSGAATRLAVLGGLLGASVAAVSSGLVLALAALAVGGFGALAAATLGGRARAVEAGQRRRADALVALLAGGRVAGLDAPNGRRLRPGRRGLDRIDTEG